MADKITVAGDTVQLGPIAVDSAALAGLNPTDVNARGVVLVNERAKVLIPVKDADGKERHVLFTASIYVQREALSDDESANIEKTAKEREARKKAKELADQSTREREIARAVQITREQAAHDMRNLNDMVQAARNFATIANVADSQK